MKLTVSKSEFLDVLTKVQGLCGRRSNLAITECVLLRAQTAGIDIIATDLESVYEGHIAAAVEIDGTVAVNARKLYEIIKEYPKMDVFIESLDHRKITIGGDKILFNLKSMSPDDYPEIPAIEMITPIEINSAAFKRMLEKAVAIGGMGEDKKTYINGAWLECFHETDPAVLRLVSTDGIRLAKVDLTYNPPDNQAVIAEKALIPKKGLQEVVKFLDDSGNVRIGLQGNYFIVKNPSESFAIRLLEGSFPNYLEIIERADGHYAILDKEPFLNMLKRMSILCNDKYRAVLFNFSQGLLKIEANTPEIGESNEELSIEYSADKCSANYNPRFFIDALNAIDEKKVVIDIVSEDKPCLIRGEQDTSYLGIIMPMRV